MSEQKRLGGNAGSNNEKVETTVTASLPASTLQQELELATELVKSGLTSYKKPNEALIALQFGRELGFPPAVSLMNISVVNNKPSLGVHLINGKLASNRIIIEEVCNFKASYAYYDVYDHTNKFTERAVNDILKENNSNVVLVDYFGGNENIKLLREKYLKEHQGKMIIARNLGSIVTYKTVLLFKQLSATGEVLRTHEETLYWNDLSTDITKKDNWNNYPQVMLRNRCLTNGAKFFASGILNGVMSLTEMLDSIGADYVTDAEGEVILVDQTTLGENDIVTVPTNQN